jgi:KDO2-lipid IV(A) lauroyltransferase
MAALDQSYPHLIEELVPAGEVPKVDELQERPVIFCSYHMGSYRLVVHYLISIGVKLTLLIDQNVSRDQADDFHRVTAEVQRLHGLTDGFRIIDTAAPNMLMALSRELKQKRCLLIYLDGNKGLGSANPARESLTRIPFLGSALKVRHGSAFLSYLTRAALLPVMTQRSPGNPIENVIRFFPRIEPSRSIPREEFIASAVRTMYQHLGAAVKETPAQWECWRYINNALDASTTSAGDVPAVDEIEGLLHFNQTRYMLTESKIGEQTHHLLFDRLEFGSNLLSSPFFKLLKTVEEAPRTADSLLDEDGVTHELLESLLREEILCMHDAKVRH